MIRLVVAHLMLVLRSISTIIGRTPKLAAVPGWGTARFNPMCSHNGWSSQVMLEVYQ
jgi:hypothetical protein